MITVEPREIRKRIIEALNDVGVILMNDEDDVDISELITDSLQWISFIISLEDRMGVEWPDELVLIDNFTSLNALVRLVFDILNRKEEIIDA